MAINAINKFMPFLGRNQAVNPVKQKQAEQMQGVRQAFHGVNPDNKGVQDEYGNRVQHNSPVVKNKFLANRLDIMA